MRRIRMWLFGGDFELTTGDDEDEIVLFSFHQYGALEKAWLWCKSKLEGEPFEDSV